MVRTIELVKLDGKVCCVVVGEMCSVQFKTDRENTVFVSGISHLPIGLYLGKSSNIKKEEN